MSYSIDSEAHPAGEVIVVAGEADASAASALDDAIRNAVVETLGKEGGEVIIVDLTGANFVDSRTIGVLVSWLEQLQGRGWRLPLVCSDANLLRLFSLIGLEQMFEFHESRDAAAAGAGAG